MFEQFLPVCIICIIALPWKSIKNFFVMQVQSHNLRQAVQRKAGRAGLRPDQRKTETADRCRVCRTGNSPGLTFAACGRRTDPLSLNYVIMVYHSPLFAVSKHFSTFFKKVLARIYFYGKLFVKVHRQTRRKSATQSYRDPPGQPVASKKLLFCCCQQICGFSRNRS